MKRYQREPWRDEIAPIAERYAELYHELVEAVRVMRPEEQLALLDAVMQGGMTNCGWYEYDAAKLVRAALPVREVIERRIARIPDPEPARRRRRRAA